MALQLRLDATALAALFPEGSEARVELQRAVTDEFIRKHLNSKLVADEVVGLLNRAKQEAITEATRKLCDSHGWAYNNVLSDTFKARIREEAQHFVYDETRKIVKAECERFSNNIEQTIIDRMETLIDTTARAHVSTKLKERLNSALDMLGKS